MYNLVIPQNVFVESIVKKILLKLHREKNIKLTKNQKNIILCQLAILLPLMKDMNWKEYYKKIGWRENNAK